MQIWVESNWGQVRVNKTKLEVQEPQEAHCKWRKITRPVHLAPALIENLVTNLVSACFKSLPGRMRQTMVWISLDENNEIVDFLEYTANEKPLWQCV
jgi:hypothetical protein